MGFVPQPAEFGFKFNFLLKIYANYMKRWLKYVLFGGHHMCFALPSHIELSPKIKVKVQNYLIMCFDKWMNALHMKNFLQI
jgi:hypothetical protein